MKCEACPFRDGETLEATQAQNYGCLPTANEMIEGVEKRGLALSCHDTDKACRGLIEVKPQASSLPVKTYLDWYRNGWSHSPCCDNEIRNINGGCDNCGDPCL